MIRHNLPYKLLAIIVALVLWTYVNAERRPQSTRTLTVPVTVQGLPKGFVAELGVDDANVTLQGLKSTVDAIRRDDIRAWVDLKVDLARETAEQTLPVRTRVLGVRENELDVRVEPRSIRIRVEAVSGKRLPVEVKFVSAPPVGYAYSDPVISPPSVKVSGKSATVAAVNRLVVTLTGEQQSGPVDDYFDISPLDSRGNIVRGIVLEPDRVRLKLQLTEVPATKAVIVSPNVVGEPEFPARVTRVTSNPASVTLQGRPGALVGVSTITTDRVSIDGAGSTVSKEVDLRLPPGVEMAGRASVRVTVHISAPE